MTKALTKLSLLGCVSTCLINVAYAEVATNSDDIIVFAEPKPYLPDVVCRSQARNPDFYIKNIGDDPFSVSNIFIKINHAGHDADTLNSHASPPVNDGDDIISILPVTHNDEDVCGYKREGGARFPFDLKPGQKCKIETLIDTDITNVCGTNSSVPPKTGTINRDLIVEYNGPDSPLASRIFFDFTYTGSASRFSLIGNNITNSDDNLAAVSPVQVEGDVAITHPHGHLTHDINYVGDHNRPYRFGDVPRYALYDIQAAFDNFSDLYSNSCTKLEHIHTLTNDLSQYNNGHGDGVFRQASPGVQVYCLDPSLAHQAMVVNGPVTIDGTDESYFVFYVQGEGHTPGFYINSGAAFNFTGHANAENVIVIAHGDGGIEQYENSSISALLYANGGYEAETNNPPGAGSAPFVIGGIYAVNNDIELDGNAIANP